MAENTTPGLIDQGTIPFQTEGRLLEELGLRLVASPEVALVELIKNSYDADSPMCTVHLKDNNNLLVVVDQGHGMTFADFKTRWMRIATSLKSKEGVSPKYRRRLTGAKGIGRFAARYLGNHLLLESVASDPKYNCKTKLTAAFDWAVLDAYDDIAKATVNYELVSVDDSHSSGTSLTIRGLREATDFVSSRELRDNVLKMISPIQGLESGKFSSVQKDKGSDPGFRVILPGMSGRDDLDLAKLVLDNYWARLTIELSKNELRFLVWFSGAKKSKGLTVKVNSRISNGFFADIRFFPRRKGIFQGKEVGGRRAWAWVRDNCGVAVVDHGFRIKPYGFENDDWLSLDLHAARNKRDWQTDIAKIHFPILPGIRANPGANPSLNLPYNAQLAGAVFILSQPAPGEGEIVDLIPAMDREGLLANKAFDDFKEYVRAGIEFLAHLDKLEVDRQAEEEAKKLARAAREDIRRAIERIQETPTLTAGDKSRIVKQYHGLAERLDEQEQYSEQSKRSLLVMSLLGVVAGFMTHESKAVVHEMERALAQVRALVRKNPSLAETAEELSRRLDSFKSYLDYARMFVQKARVSNDQPLSAHAQVRVILNQFKVFADERKIKISNQVPPDLKTPPLSVTLYSGVLLNLYTNALKAVTTAKSSIRDPHICFRARNEKGKHIVEVADNGIGIPQEMRKRIWDPLYTTTSDIGNPLGSGMGLGLTLVKQVVGEMGGTVTLAADPPTGFTTCFRVTFSNR